MSKKISNNKDFELSFNHFAIGMAIVSPDGRWLQVNPALSNIVGYGEEELLKIDFQTITHKDDLHADLEYVRQMLTGERKTYQMEKRYFHKKGHIVWILLSVSLARDEETNKPLYFISQIQGITRQVKIAEDLKETQARYDRAVKAPSVGLWEWDINTDEVFWSPEIKKMLGLALDKKLPTLSELENLIHPGDREYRKEVFKNHLEKNSPFDFEYRMMHQKGYYIWLHSKGQAIKDDEGKAIYMSGSVDEVTKKKESELALNKSQALCTQALSHSNLAVQNIDFLTQKLFCDSRFYEILGISDKNFVFTPENYEDLIHPDDKKLRNQALLRVKQENGSSYNVEYRMKHTKGFYVWLQVRGRVDFDASGKPISMTGTADDISKRKQSAQKIKESEQRFELVVQGSRDGIWDWPDITKDAQYWSSQWKELLGYKDDEIDAKSSVFFSLIHPEDKNRVAPFLNEALENQACFDCEYRLKTKSGNYKWFQGRGIVTINNNVTRMTGSLSDISIRKDDEEKLAEYNKELERINEDLNSFAYIASHDLKEPVRGIYSNVLFLEQDFAGKMLPEVPRRLGRIAYLCERMEKLIDDLLNYAKLKDQDLVIKRVDLNRIVQDIQTTIAKNSDNVSVQIILPRELPKVICDEVTITELFRNLINNGIKYNENEKKIIEIGYDRIVDEDKIPKYAFYVKDNGVGIAKKNQKNIFHVFKRLDNTEQLVQGSGVGLSFVQRIVERNQGRIWIESEEGKGSIFHFTLN